MDDHPPGLPTDKQDTRQEVPKPRRAKLIVAIVALVLLLAGAAFVGGRLLNQTAGQSGSNAEVLAGGRSGQQGASWEIVPAEGLPHDEPVAMGLFAERKDNSIFVTIGDRFTVDVDRNGTVNAQTNGNGDKLEIVITTNTTLYKSVMPNDMPSGGGKVQQQLAPGALDELGAASIVSVWGERRGDRVLATILVYEQPQMPPQKQ